MAESISSTAAPSSSLHSNVSELPADIAAILDLVDVPAPARTDEDEAEDMDMDSDTEAVKGTGASSGDASDSDEVERALVLDDGEDSEDDNIKDNTIATSKILDIRSNNAPAALEGPSPANGRAADDNDNAAASDSDSSSDWRSSSSESGDDVKGTGPSKIKRITAKSRAELSSRIQAMNGESDDDNDNGEGPSTSGPLKTANEIVSPEIEMPTIEYLDEGDVLEHLGEVMSIIDSVVVIKGSSGAAGEKVLDTGSLLAWEDRKVLGMIFETFGPTTLPLYSVRFPSAQAIDRDSTTVSRKVFHVPAKSHYVFTRALRQFKGSDASNIFDEEIGEDDMEFSDDEQEAEYKRAIRERREARREARQETNEPNSRYQPTRPEPPPRDLPMHDGDVPFTSEAYDDTSRPTRSAPTPYDEYVPYREEHEEGEKNLGEGSSTSTHRLSPLPSPMVLVSDVGSSRGRGNGRGRGGGEWGRGKGRTKDRGRGRGRGGAGGGRGRGRGGGGESFQPPSFPPFSFSSFPLPNFPFPPNISMPQAADSYEEYDPRHPQMNGPSPRSTPLPLRSTSPTSLAIARATGQMGIQMNDMNGMPITPMDGGGWDVSTNPQLASMQQQFFAMSNMAIQMQHGSDFTTHSGPRRCSSGNAVPAPHINPNFLMGGMGIGPGMGMHGGMPMPWGFPAGAMDSQGMLSSDFNALSGVQDQQQQQFAIISNVGGDGALTRATHYSFDGLSHVGDDLADHGQESS
ncbi:hypothetical protein FRB95_011151 [Tulasnella sp. JGI-2019a]|nr:hypothetical protein FRB95_011151 [Tulasnella sp. JGI-2019a]